MPLELQMQTLNFGGPKRTGAGFARSPASGKKTVAALLSEVEYNSGAVDSRASPSRF
jgi:hypothetical protein